MKESWAFLRGDTTTSNMRKSDGLFRNMCPGAAAVFWTGINQVLANEYLEDSGIGSHVEVSRGGSQLDR